MSVYVKTVVLGMKPVNKEDIDPFEEIIEKVKEEKGLRFSSEYMDGELGLVYHSAHLNLSR